MSFRAIESLIWTEFFSSEKVLAEVCTERMDPKSRISFKGCHEIWNSSILTPFSPPQAEDFLHARFPLAARRRLLPGNRHNNDTGALSRPALVVLASSPQ